MLETNFSALDWAIVGAYLVGTVIIGLWVNRYIKGMGEFLVAGRSLKTRLGIATMIGSELGLVTAMFAAPRQNTWSKLVLEASCLTSRKIIPRQGHHSTRQEKR